ncbi:MAG: hemolysin III family protein [Pseudomonadales bacterium]|nr:hemolysin III family protein [Pseudomonadales bacterium]
MYYGERLNSISHLVGAVFALIALGSLLTLALQSQDPLIITGFTVFGTTMVLLYTMSTLYHSFPQPHLKAIFKVLDHVSIYLLIAGTYTPFMLIGLRGEKGLTILAVVWALALVGILTEVFLRGKLVKICQLIIYLAMGWACAFQMDDVKAALHGQSFYWLWLGGIAYTAGVVFYLLDKVNRLQHAHGIWHFFVMCGTIAHFIAVLGFV